MPKPEVLRIKKGLSWLIVKGVIPLRPRENPLEKVAKIIFETRVFLRDSVSYERFVELPEVKGFIDSFREGRDVNKAYQGLKKLYPEVDFLDSLKRDNYCNLLRGLTEKKGFAPDSLPLDLLRGFPYSKKMVYEALTDKAKFTSEREGVYKTAGDIVELFERLKGGIDKGWSPDISLRDTSVRKSPFPLEIDESVKRSAPDMIFRKPEIEIKKKERVNIDKTTAYVRQPYTLRDIERRINNEEYERIKEDLLKNHRGKYTVIAQGRLQGIRDSFEEAKEIKVGEAHHILLFKIEEPKRREVRLGWRASMQIR